LRPRTRI